MSACLSFLSFFPFLSFVVFSLEGGEVELELVKGKRKTCILFYFVACAYEARVNLRAKEGGKKKRGRGER